MMRRTLEAMLVMIACLGLSLVSTTAGPLSIKDSQRRAYQALQASLAAVGLPHVMQSGGTMITRMSGEVRDHAQGDAPGKSHQPKPVTLTAAADLRRNWVEVTAVREFLGGAVLDSRFILKPEGGFYLNRYNKHYAAITPQALRAWDFLYYTIPAMVLKQAYGNASSLRWLGEEGKGAGRIERVSFSWNDTLYTLTLGAENHLPLGLELLAPLAVDGDTVIRFTYDDYKSFGSVHAPTHVTWELEDNAFISLRTDDVRVGETLAPERFELPSDAHEIKPSSFAVEPLADGVYLFKGPRGYLGNVLHYDALIVDLGESVLVVDAPLASAYAAAMLGAIQKTVPGKPVRYLVSTHYHYDHSGGARPFMAAGATIVTTRGNREHFERLAAVQSTLRSDKLQIDPGKLDFRFVDKMDRIEGSARTVEVYRLDSLSHVDEMLVVYLPKERLVFQADLYSESVAPNASTHEFAEWLSSTKGLKVDRIAGVHAPVITLSELLAVVAE